MTASKALRSLAVVVPAVAMFGMVIVAAAPGQTVEKNKNEQAVTIRGCVQAGTKPDTFMLMGVTEVRPGETQEQAVPADPEGRPVLYWLSSTKGLKVKAGQRVEVKGTIDSNDPQQGETKASEDSSKRLDAKTEMKSDGKSVTVKTDSQPEVAPTTTSGTLVKNSDKEVQRVVYRLKVSSVRSVQGTCQP